MNKPEQSRPWYRNDLLGWGFFCYVALAGGHWKPVLIGSVIGLALAFYKHGWPWTWRRP